MRAATPRTRGFTLVEIAVVLFIVGVLIAMAAAITRGVSAAQKRSLTATKMATVDAALVQFVQQQKRLPCPADGTLASTNASAGLDNGCAGNQANGVVPWRSLGLSEQDATDGWDRRFTYRVAPNLVTANVMDMSWCDPAGSESPDPPALPPALPRTCTAGCTSATLTACTKPYAYLKYRGLQVQSIAGAVLMNPMGDPHTGAAYVLISHGETGGGGYLGSGSLGVSTSSDGTEEQKNYANLAVTGYYTTANAIVGYYVDDSLSDTAGNGHFDDMVSRPSVLQVITKAGLGPRTH